MLQGFQLSLTLDPRVGPLFETIDISVGDGEKVALIGRNGVGKTSLLRILAQLDPPSSGKVVLTAGSAIAYLPQDFDTGFDGTLAEFYYSNLPHYALARAASRVGLPVGLLQVPYTTLSLGEKMRGAIAGLLATEPTVLLLDEPTNHLDIEAKAWLTEFLKDCQESVLLVCHDRAILNAVPEKIYEITPHGLEMYSGNYAQMLQEKEDFQARRQREWEAHQAETRRLKVAAEGIRQRAIKTGKKPKGNNYDAFQKPFFEAKKARVEKQAKAVLKRVEREIDSTAEKPFMVDALKVEFPTKPLRATIPLSVRGLSKSFGPRRLFDGLNLTADHRDRIAIVGPNGCGKTTLFRILMGQETADAGEFHWSSDVSLAAMSQDRNSIPLDLPAFRAAGGDPESARTLLACLGMRGLVGERSVRHLSVGERTKVEIASMILRGANVLMLDEPTNHLDLASIEALEAALRDFPGVILFISHDREFVDRLATEVLEMNRNG